jgi:short subunit dehydrogenase-like uncharacterized protein
MRLLIYGANGYTGKLIAQEAVKRGLAPVLAGRSVQAIRALADSLRLESRVFALDSIEHAIGGLPGIQVVLNCAGPFVRTAEPLMQACLNANVGAHYFDITGEIPVFEMAQALSARASRAGIVLCPGVGFDVIPTDCAALALKNALPDATELALGFETGKELSPGTAKTVVEGLKNGGQIRRDGVITRVPFAFAVRSIDFGNGQRTAMSIPWGDVSTAFHTTGIPNITTFMASSRTNVRIMKAANFAAPLLGSRPVKVVLFKQIEKKVKGPDWQALKDIRTFVWGEARNGNGRTAVIRFSTSSAYAVTVNGALAVVESFLRGRPESGAWTPARLMGADFVFELPGVSKPQIITA